MTKKLLKNAPVYLLAGLLLWYLFKDTDWVALLGAIRAAHWGWLALGTALIFAAFFARVQRWSYIVRSVKPVPYRDLFSATQIGFLGNFVLPGRLGEVIRALVLGRLAALPFTKCFAFVALDRVTDLFGLIAVMLVTAGAFRPKADIVLPPELDSRVIPQHLITNGALVTTLLLVGIILAFVLLYTNQRLALRISDAVSGPAGRSSGALVEFVARGLPGGLGARLRAFSVKLRRLESFAHGLVQHFAEGMHVFRSAKDILLALCCTAVVWTLGILSYLCMNAAFGLGQGMPWYTGFMVMTLLSLFISVPGPPGFVGTFHVAIVAALVIIKPEVDLSAAKAVAIVAHLLNLLAVVVVGLYCLHRERLGLLALRRESAEIRKDDSEE